MHQQHRLLRWAAGSATALLFTVGAVQAAPLPDGWTTNGNAGTNTAADGVVSLAPGFGSYQWLSTVDSPDGGGSLPVGPTGEETNGTTVKTPTFAVAAGDSLKFFFNYITSDGDEYTEYAWAALYSGASTFDTYLFTARTTPTGDTVPGFGLPGLGAGVTLTPSSTPIIPGGPVFSPLGDSSGSCYGEGCGYTGWIQMDYAFSAAGVYSLNFGVTNALDDAYDSAFAVAGVTINDVPVIPEPASVVLMSLGLAALAVVSRRRQPGSRRLAD